MSYFNSYSGAPDDVQQGSRHRIRSFFVSLLIIILFFFLFGNSFRSPIGIKLEQSGLTLSGSAEYTVTLAYEDITSIELADRLDLGALVDGTEASSECSGLWKNDQWGEYSLFIDPDISRYLIFTTADDSVVVFNYENNNSTESFYDSFCDMLEQYGLADQITFTSFQDAA